MLSITLGGRGGAKYSMYELLTCSLLSISQSCEILTFHSLTVFKMRQTQYEKDPIEE